MSDVTRLLGRQLAAGLRQAPGRLRPGSAAERRLAAAGTIEELQEAARRALPKVIYEFIAGGAGDEITLARNRSDFAAWEILPRSLVDVSQVDLTTTVLGREIALPVIGAPTGLCGLIQHDGELGLARAMHASGSIYSLAAMGSYSVEEVAQGSGGPLWFQTYLWRDKGLVGELLDRAREQRYEALVVTVDVPRAAARDRDRRNGFGMPPKMTPRTVYEGLRHPAWTVDFIRRPRITAASVAASSGTIGDSYSVASYVDAQFDPGATWEELEWLRANWDGPLVVKGVLTADDARRSVALGAQAVVVSNHGGRQLDHVPSSIAALPGVVDEVGGEAEIYLDSGIRRGGDVVKALALGARAVLVGRPIVFGLGAGGEAGARRAVEILETELRGTLGLMGCASVRELGAAHVRRHGA